jgi:hypothetical protein
MKKTRKTRLDPFPFVTLRTLSINFDARTVTIDGSTVSVHPDQTGLVIPILSGSAVFVVKGGERIA